MKKLFLLLPLITLLGLGCSKPAPAPTPEPDQTVCTQEANICPDGSFVGRSGPNCEFTACPTVSIDEGSVITTSAVGLNSAAAIPGMAITPLEVLEDSRCAVDVQCIWAGTVRLRASIASVGAAEEVTLTLGTPFDFGGLHVTLSEVSPAPHSKKTITPAEYRFKFTITK